MNKLAIASILAGASLGVQADMAITGVFDGPLTGGVPKGVELYVVSDIADLSVYSLGSANNGGGSDGEEFTFPAVAASAGQYIYVASESVQFNNFFGFAPDYTSGSMSINGDDAIELFQNGGVVDLFGDINTDGTGEPWEYLDGWAYRNSGTVRNSTFTVSDWSFSGTNALDGEAANATASSPIPVGTFTSSGGGSGSSTTVLINEVDADTEGSDVLEFIELYDGGVGATDLSGLSLVLYNGSDNLSYGAIDLDGFATDANGYFVVGNASVANIGLVVAGNSIQNGADAVALVSGDASDFPNDSPLPGENLLDAIVYDTNDGDNATLLSLLNAGQPQVNEAAGAGSATDSNQRCENGQGGLRNTNTYRQATPTPGAANNCTVAATLRLISEIQGNPDTYVSNDFGDTDVSPLFGEMVMVDAIVVGDFQNGDADTGRDLNGFFLQEESTDEDGDVSSSEGIFVFDRDFGTDVNLGDRVRVTGTVGQFFGESQITNVTAVEVVESGLLNAVTPASVALLGSSDVTTDQGGNFQPDLESYEGMLVTFVETLQITEQFNLDRFNEIKLVAGERPVQFSQQHTPDAILFDQAQRALGARRITYDDGLNAQNVSIDKLDGFAPYSEASAKRMGDTIDNLTGVLDYKWAGSSSSAATWRVRSHIDGTNGFTSTEGGDSPNLRPLAPESVEGTLKIASFNVLNFFTTLDDGDTNTAVGLSPRGADDLTRFGVEPATAELNRQQAKLVNAIIAMDADILGLVEMENEFDAINDGSTAIETLVNAVNGELGSNQYTYVYPGQQFVGTDAIAVAFIYKPAVVSLAEGSSVAMLDDGVAATLDVFAGRDFDADPIFNGPATNRVSLAASFTHLESGDSLTVVANHFKSKGPSGLSDTTSPNFDQADGAGFWNQRRLDGAVAVNEWLATNPTGLEDDDRVILGDLNAYAQEEPVQYLIANGFNNVEDDDAYSFVFDGQVGTLDYLLVSDSLLAKLSGVSVWHINADEADALDYNLDFGRSDSYFDGSTATRNSDHDPLFIGLNPLPESVDLLDAFYQALRQGAIEGVGRNRFRQFINLHRYYRLLAKAQWFEENGRTGKACKLLAKAEARSDGVHRDFIQGDGVAAFNRLIIQRSSQLNCW
ncbi:ExeM/NucH family extracellular endonuclease [bacterium SCSIO 12696]|nr:ExeM/NucH family extracellular endonuclease [bacterium SCSIO 12696]